MLDSVFSRACLNLSTGGKCAESGCVPAVPDILHYLFGRVLHSGAAHQRPPQQILCKLTLYQSLELFI